MTKALLLLVLLAAVAGGALLVSTPSVRNLRALIRAEALRRGEAGPPAVPPPRFVSALVATEDQRFFEVIDPGVDPVAVIRVAYETVTGRRGDLGGSTITQQLAKLVYGSGHDGFGGKLKQVILAVKLSLTYSRRDILQMYAETVYYGDGNYGLAAASCGYFGKEPAALGWHQAALLAGIVNAPSADNPRAHPERAAARVAHVFARLVAVGALSASRASEEMATPLALVPRGTCDRS